VHELVIIETEKLYWYLHPKLNSYGYNHKIPFTECELLYTYWLPNTY